MKYKELRDALMAGDKPAFGIKDSGDGAQPNKWVLQMVSGNYHIVPKRLFDEMLYIYEAKELKGDLIGVEDRKVVLRDE